MSKTIDRNNAAIAALVREEYEAGKPMLWLYAKYGYAPNMIRRALVSVGVEIRAQGNPNAFLTVKRTILAAQWPEIVNRYNSGETLQGIGDSFGVTRERIRQIVIISGCAARMPSIKERGAARRAKVDFARASKREQRQKRTLERRMALCRKLEPLWNDPSISLEEIRAKVGINDIVARVMKMRRWFPGVLIKRTKGGFRPHESPEKVMARRRSNAELLSPLWMDASMTVAEIAQRMGKALNTIYSNAYQYRKLWPDLFPRRERWPAIH